MMHRIELLGLVIVLWLAPAGFAETIHFSDGRVVEGKIEERGQFSIKVSSGGKLVKYYMDEITRIEEDAPEGPSKADLVKKFMDVSGTRSSMENSINRIIEQVPLEQQAPLRELFNIAEIIDSLVPVYEKYYSEEELGQLIRFYESPIGQKVLSVTPEIMREVMQKSAEYLKAVSPSP